MKLQSNVCKYLNSNFQKKAASRDEKLCNFSEFLLNNPESIICRRRSYSH